MFRLMGRIEIYGTKFSVDRRELVASIPDGTMTQTGSKFKVSEEDSWIYVSPWYHFHINTMDDEIRDFLTAHESIGEVLASCNAGIEHAFFTLCPVEQSDQAIFAGVFSNDTLKTLTKMGLDLQIAPATMMPDALYWKQ